MRQFLKAAPPAAGNRPCTERHLGGLMVSTLPSTMLAFPENLFSSQLPTTQRTRQDRGGQGKTPWTPLDLPFWVYLLSIPLPTCLASPSRPYLVCSYLDDRCTPTRRCPPFCPFPFKTPVSAAAPAVFLRQKLTQDTLPLKALP